MRAQNKIDLYSLLDEESEPETIHYGHKRVAPHRQKKSDFDAQVRKMLVEELRKEENQFEFTYQASRHEQMWISNALQEFHNDSLIDDVLSMVHAGKEANVYCCKANPNIGLPLLAAKIYRPRLLRNLKNDAIYKEGRTPVGDDGKQLRNDRELRAIQHKTRFGKQLSITSWIEHEFMTLQALYKAGVAVPIPVAQVGNAILMEYVGEIAAPAPVLFSVRLEQPEARRLFDFLIHNIELMLANNCIHADLSAYNVLYLEGEVKIIDFPQVVNPFINPYAIAFLRRDIQRICQYFDRYEVRSDPVRLASDLCERYCLQFSGDAL